MSSKRSKNRSKKSLEVAPEINPTLEVPEILAVEKTTTVKAKVTQATTDKKARAANAPVHRSRQKTETATPASIAVVGSSNSEPAMAPLAPEPVGMTDMAALAHAVAPETMAYPHPEIAGLAYLYWEQRGHQHGSAAEDWLRAEREVLSRLHRA